MSLILTQTQTVTPEIAYRQSKVKSTNIYNFLERSHRELFNFLWNNPDVTIEQFLVKYGTEAVALFTVSSKIQEVLQLVNPSYVPLVPLKQVTLHDDGTVTTV